MSAFSPDFRTRSVLLALLALAMAATRMSHFGSAALLPDASVAVFFLGGLLLRRWTYFAALFLSAFCADLMLAPGSQELAWCLSPAYLGLIPTYATLWIAGRALGKRGDSFPLFASLAFVVGSVSLAFLISNAAWYLASGPVDGLGYGAFWLAVARYYPPYLGTALLYLVPLWAGYRISHLPILHAH